ncbi:hypothetical protein L596_030651 [Steinernema carpocapsae]|uniref:Uncharacterized protein n=1 Tax=Steinernema carpocapsae TaxID=34508 RepID=A0A4U5LQ13_STECR|nr:hypothetical protein L596_030651 [Steinernema carpocapsae]
MESPQCFYQIQEFTHLRCEHSKMTSELTKTWIEEVFKPNEGSDPASIPGKAKDSGGSDDKENEDDPKDHSPTGRRASKATGVRYRAVVRSLK